MSDITSKGEAEAAAQGRGAEFELGSLLGYRLLRLSTAIGNLADRDANEVAGLRLPEYRVLTVLHSRGPSGVVELQQAMLIDKAWISRTLTALVKKRLVTAAPDANDLRRTTYAVTEKGGKAALALIERALQRQKRILKGLKPEEIERMIGALTKVQANVDDATA